MIVTYIGGSRSGKSVFAEKEFKESVCYIATAKAYDKEMEKRVSIHKDRRPKEWRTFEADLSLDNIIFSEKNYILDDVTNFLSSIVFDFSKDLVYIDAYTENRILEYAKNSLDDFFKDIRNNKKNLSIVTNELGMSIVPDNRLSRVFRDINGKINEFIAENSDVVYLVIAGIRLRIK